MDCGLPFKRVLEDKRKKGALSKDTFKHINNQRLTKSTKGQTKILMTCTKSKRWICDGNVYILEFRLYFLGD